MQGIRKLPVGRGRVSTRTHSPQFFRDVTRMVKQYLASRPDPAITEFLTYDFVALNARFGRVDRRRVPALSVVSAALCRGAGGPPGGCGAWRAGRTGEAAGRADALYGRGSGRAGVLQKTSRKVKRRVVKRCRLPTSRPLRLLPHQRLQPLSQPIDFRGQTFDVGLCRREVAGAAVASSVSAAPAAPARRRSGSIPSTDGPCATPRRRCRRRRRRATSATIAGASDRKMPAISASRSRSPSTRCRASSRLNAGAAP